MSEPESTAPSSASVPILEQISPTFAYVVVSSNYDVELVGRSLSDWLRSSLTEEGIAELAVLGTDAVSYFERALVVIDSNDENYGYAYPDKEAVPVFPEEQQMLEALRKETNVHGAWLRSKTRDVSITLEQAVNVGHLFTSEGYIHDAGIDRVSFFLWGATRICVVHLSP